MFGRFSPLVWPPDSIEPRSPRGSQEFIEAVARPASRQPPQHSWLVRIEPADGFARSRGRYCVSDASLFNRARWRKPPAATPTSLSCSAIMKHAELVCVCDVLVGEQDANEEEEDAR